MLVACATAAEPAKVARLPQFTDHLQRQQCIFKTETQPQQSIAHKLHFKFAVAVGSTALKQTCQVICGLEPCSSTCHVLHLLWFRQGLQKQQPQQTRRVPTPVGKKMMNNISPSQHKQHAQCVVWLLCPLHANSRCIPRHFAGGFINHQRYGGKNCCPTACS